MAKTPLRAQGDTYGRAGSWLTDQASTNFGLNHQINDDPELANRDKFTNHIDPLGVIKTGRGRTPLQSHLDPFGIFWGEDKPPLTFNRNNPLPPSQAYQTYREAENLARATGNSGQADAAHRAWMHAQGQLGPGFNEADYNIQQFPENDWMSLGGANTSDAEAGLRRLFRDRMKRQFQNRGSGDLDAAMNRFRLGQSARIEETQKQGLISEIDPTLRSAQELSTNMMNTPAVSASEEQAMRSRVVSMIRASEQQRQSRVAATMGLGNMSGSPAIAALASSTADEADQAIVGTLRDMGLQVSELNRQEARTNIDLATRIATARHNLLSGDTKSIIGMRSDIAQMIDTLYSRDQTMKMNAQSVEASQSGGANPYISAGISAAGLIAAPFTAGLSIPAAGVANAAYGASQAKAPAPPPAYLQTHYDPENYGNG